MAIGDAIMFTGCLAGLMVALPALLIFLNLMFTRTTFSAAQRLHERHPHLEGLELDRHDGLWLVLPDHA